MGILEGGSVRKMFGEGALLEELRSTLARDVNPVWDSLVRRVEAAAATAA